MSKRAWRLAAAALGLAACRAEPPAGAAPPASAAPEIASAMPSASAAAGGAVAAPSAAPSGEPAVGSVADLLLSPVGPPLFAWSPDSKTLVLALEGEVAIASAMAPVSVRRRIAPGALRSRDDDVERIATAFSGARLALCVPGGRVLLFDDARAGPARALDPTSKVDEPPAHCSLAFSPDGTLLAALLGPPEGGSYSGYIRLWRASGEMVREIEIYGRETLFFGGAGASIVALGGGHLQTWDVATGESRGEKSELPATLVPSPDGEAAVAVEGERATLFRLSPWKKMGPALAVPKERGDIREIRFVEGGAALLANGGNGWWRRVDLRTRTVTRLVEPEASFADTQLSNDARTVLEVVDGKARLREREGEGATELPDADAYALAPDGGLVAAVGADALLLLDKSGRVLYREALARGGEPHAPARTAAAPASSAAPTSPPSAPAPAIPTAPADALPAGGALVWSPDGGRLLVVHDQTASLVAPRERPPVRLRGLAKPMEWIDTMRVAFSARGERLAICGEGARVAVHRLADGALLAEMDAHGAPRDGGTLSDCVVAFSPDASLIAASTESLDRRHVRVWRATGALVHDFVDPPRAHSLAFSQDGRRLVAAGIGLAVWEMGSGRLLSRPDTYYDGSFGHVTVSPDGRFAAEQSGAGHTMPLYNVWPWRRVSTVLAVQDCSKGHIGWPGFSNGGDVVTAEAQGQWYAYRTGPTVPRLARFTLPPDVPKSELSKDGSTVLAVTEREVSVWDAATGRKLRKLDPRATGWQLSPDGRQVAATTEAALFVWSVADGSVVVRVPITRE
jgi:WD40 repeat protein